MSKYTLTIDGKTTTQHTSIRSAEAAMRARSTMGQIAVDAPICGRWRGSKARTIRGGGLVYVIYMTNAQAMSGEVRIARD
jgi:hypothetical protein